MYKELSLALIFIFSLANVLHAQTEPDRSQDHLPPLTLDAHGYPISFWGEEHSSFELNYRLSPKLIAQLQGFYDEYACEVCTDRFRTFVGLKRYVSNKVYLISGIEIEAEFSAIGRKPRTPRVGFIGGVGYDVRENLLLEAKGNFQLNNSKMGAFGEPQIRMPRIYTVGGKLKF